MATLKLASSLMAVAAFAVAQSVGAIGLPNVSNVHTGKQLKEINNFGAAIKGGTPDLLLRLRYENVKDTIPAASPIAGTDNADLTSLRTVLGYSTARYNGFYGRIEFEATTHVGDKDALTLGDDLTFPPGPVGSRNAVGSSIIPDPTKEEFNEAYIGWRSASSGCSNAPGGCNGSTTIKAGRQDIVYDNHRWVGNILWRQNFQSYDAVRIDNTSINNLGVSYVYLDKVNRTFGPGSPFNEWRMKNSSLINVSYKLPVGKLVGYGYLLDYDDNPRTPFVEGVGAGVGVTNFDSDTWGLRYTGKYKLSDGFTLLSELEWANQKPTGDANSALSDNNYYNVEFGAAFKLGGKSVVVKAGQEILEGNGVNALQTPLATFHAFNGWADKFISPIGGTATPVGGLEDTSVTLIVKGLIGKSKLVVVYHDFQANTSTASGIENYGEEWNALFAKPLSKNLLVAIKYANFSDGGDGFSFDTEKFWLLTQYKFK
ncbi:hypothetical protein MNBD_GAMMA05-151 [hydrothermal vent metagenome]|uniref:Alginate export domain-containing protein n=1 Tax=hydrothermal vent metagenome TaxID=652676 RepID=A0A3B0WLQ1_9ZZZZ